HDFWDPAAKDELYGELAAFEAYEEGEGISGSVLLTSFAAYSARTTLVGTNQLGIDPRMSNQHKGGYEKVLNRSVSGGVLRHFWSFPLFKSGTLIGAVRVANKLEPDGKSVSLEGWGPRDLRNLRDLIEALGQMDTWSLLDVQPGLP